MSNTSYRQLVTGRSMVSITPTTTPEDVGLHLQEAGRGLTQFLHKHGLDIDWRTFKVDAEVDSFRTHAGEVLREVLTIELSAEGVARG